MSTTTHSAYSMNPIVRGTDLRKALATIKHQREWKLVGVLSAFAVVIVGLLGAEAMMLSGTEEAAPMENSQPGQPAPVTPD